MSYNNLLNAVIALVEDRPADAREMLRNPDTKIPVGEVQSRIFQAVKNREDSAQKSILKDVLRTSLRIDANKPKAKVDWSEDQREAFLMGVAAVEQIVEDYLASFGFKA